MNSNASSVYENLVDNSADTILDNVQISVAQLDKNYRFLLANKHYASKFLKNPDDLKGQHIADVIGLQQYKNYSKPHLDKAFSGEIQHFRLWTSHPKMESCYLDVNYMPVKDNKGRVLSVVISASDITDLKRKEELLIRYEQIVNSITDMVVFVSKDFTYEAVNDQFLNAFSLSRDKVIGKHSKDIVGEENFEKISKPNIEKALNGEIEHLKSWSLQKSRGDRYMNFKYSPCFEQDGEISGVIVTAQDITDSIQAETNIDLYNAIVNTSSDYLAIIDSEFRYQLVNNKYADAFEMKKQDFVGKHMAQVLGEKVFNEISLPNIQQCIKHTKFKDSCWVNHPNGGKKYLDFEYAAHKNEKGNLLCVLIAGHDVTELYKSRSVLEEREQSLNKAQEIAGLGMWRWDLILDEMVVSPQTCIVMSNGEYNQEWFSKMDNVKTLFHPDDVEWVDNTISQSMQTGDNYDIEHKIIWPNGSIRWIHVQATPEFNDGVCTAMVGTSMDVTKRRQAQEGVRLLNEQLEARVIERTHQLEETNNSLKNSLQELKSTQDQLIQSEKMASLGSLVAGVAHEINTPVGMCVSTASYLDERLRVWNNQYQQDALSREDFEDLLNTSKESMQIMMSNLKRSADLIRSFKQVAVDQSSDRMRKLFLHQYLEEVIQSLKPEFKNKQHNVQLNCPAEFQLYTNPGAISQIITNLIMNSLIHAFDIGQEGNICIDVRKEAETVKIIYIDDGKGMTEKHREKIFEPFFTTKRGSGGSGLGMHVTFNLVSQTLRGNIICKSEAGGGVRFEITFPFLESCPEG